MANPTAAMLVIGDEILTGRTRDSNMHHLAQVLFRAGIDLCEVRVVPDVEAAIIAALDALRGGHAHVFTSGGIGPTHDDITADAVARAFGVPIGVREDARAILARRAERMGHELNAARLRMARIPEGATLIRNPVSDAPGFTIGNVHVMAGVPQVFEAMLAEVVPTLVGGRPPTVRTLRVDHPEGDVAGPLGEVATAFPDLSIGSYPFIVQGRYGTNLVFRGADPDRVAAAVHGLLAAVPDARE